MATPADQRLLELCDKWLKSLELHIRYSSLDTDSYWKVQPWPEHQRPSRWIIDLAVQKAAALRSQVQERIKQGDTRFSDSLELMTFLANLIGSEHIERFIPLADPENEVDLKTVPAIRENPPPAAPPAAAPPAAAPPAAAPPAMPPRDAPPPAPRRVHAAEAPRAAAPPADPGATATREMPRPPIRQKPASEATATREMPEFVAPKRRAPPAVGTQHVARTERRSTHAKITPRSSAKQPAKLEGSSEAAREQVIADAARLVQWGRKWYELAELIARMADRPPLSEVRKILKDNKTAIEKKAGGR
jgi:hypothetical protein